MGGASIVELAFRGVARWIDVRGRNVLIISLLAFVVKKCTDWSETAMDPQDGIQRSHHMEGTEEFLRDQI